MRNFLKALLCAWFALLVLPAPLQAQTNDYSALADQLKLVVLGDSLTSGFQLRENESLSAQLEYYGRSLKYNMRVVNMSKISQTSAQGLYRVDEVLAQKPDMVLIQLGYNDALQGIGMRELTRNLNELIHRLRYVGIDVILIYTEAPPSLRAKDKREYDTLFVNLASGYNIRYFSLLRSIQGRRQLTLDDQTHPNAKGVALIVNQLFPLIEPVLRYRLEMRAYQRQLDK